MAAVFLFAKDIEVSVSEHEAQSAIDDFLASEGHNNRSIRVSPKNISLDFKADNSAEITSDLLIDGFGYSGQFDGKFAAGIDYHRPRLYLDEISLIEGGFLTDGATQSELNDLKKVTIDIVRRQRSNHEQDESKTSSNNTDLDDTEFVEKVIISTTKTFFENIPIYDVSNLDKAGLVASLALKEVHFIEDAAIVTLSPVTALLRILGILGLLALTVLWVLGPTMAKLLLSRSKATDFKD